MIETRPLHSHEHRAGLALVVSANDAPYDMAPVAEEKLFGRGFAGEPSQLVALAGGRVDGVAVVAGRFLRLIAVDRESRRRGIGRALLHAAESIVARSHGELVVAAEAGNYFTPGIARRDASTRAFFEANGYVESTTAANLHATLEGLPALPRSVRRPESGEKSRVVEWVRETFGSIWAFETGRAFDDSEPTVYVAESHAGIEGFAAFDANNRGLGTFGPAGVRSTSRSSGIGRDLLLAALADLQRRGYDRAIIQWAAAHEFYHKVCGATVGEEFVIYAKQLHR